MVSLYNWSFQCEETICKEREERGKGREIEKNNFMYVHKFIKLKI